MASNLTICFNQEQHELITKLGEYQKILVSSIGASNSLLKVIANKSDGLSSLLTNSSKHLLQVLYSSEIKNGLTKWKFQVIKKTIENCHIAPNFDSGLFLIYLVNQAIILNAMDFHRNIINVALNRLTRKLTNDKNDLENSFILAKIDLSNLNFLRSLLRTSLFSNKLVLDSFDSDDDGDQFVNLVLKLHLASFNESLGEPGKFAFSRIIYIVSHNSCFNLNDSLVLPGILMRQDNFFCENAINNFGTKRPCHGFRCIVFDTNSLSGDFENYSEMNFEVDTSTSDLIGPRSHRRTHFLLLDQLIREFDKLTDRLKIDVIISQKVIHPSLKSHLQDRGLLIIDRLSAIYTEPVSELLKCQVFNTIWDLSRINEQHVGILLSISVKKIHGDVYVHMEGSPGPQTMIICVPNESFSQEIERLMEVTESSFRRTLINGVAVCGGPCFYSSCMCYLWKILPEILNEAACTHDNKKSFLLWHGKQIKQLFVPYLLKLLENDSDEYFLDLNSGHLFDKNTPKCVCGLFSSSSLSNHLNLNEDLSIETNVFSDPKTIKVKNQSDLKLIDCFDSKINAFNVARDILATILNVGVFFHS